MPKFNIAADIVVLDPLDKVKTITPVSLTADTATPVLTTDLNRKGHVVKNTSTGSVPIDISYGMTSPEDVGYTELYKVTLKKDEVYFMDNVAVIPYSAKAIGGAGILTVYELG